MGFRELLSPFHVSGTYWVTARKHPAKLNTHREGTWTLSKGLNPKQLMTLSGLQHQAQVCAKRKIPLGWGQLQDRAPFLPGLSLPHLDIIIHVVLLGDSCCQSKCRKENH